MRKLLTILLLATLSTFSYGVYLEKVPTRLVQPNGETLDVFITGDEFFRRVHDSEGYSIVQREDGWYVYAQYDAVQDDLVPSQYIVTSLPTRGLPMAKNIGISREKYIAKRKAYYEPTGTDASGASKNPLANNLRKGSKDAQQMNNIIICIGFSDTQNFINNFSYIDGMYSTNTNNNLHHYFSEMSYGQLDIVSSYYPPANGNVMRFYQDSNPRSYYLGNQNQAQREHTLLKNAVDWVNANYPIDPSLNLDLDNDDRCDFISFIVYGPVGNWSDLLWPHKWSLFTYNVQINGKRIYDYNFELEGSPAYFNVGTFCHEGYHVLGAPDLYHYNYGTNVYSVGGYDVMEATSNNKPQSMSAYMKSQYGEWVTGMVTAQLNHTYEVYPSYTNSGSDPEKPVIVKVPSSGTSQFYVVEYRKKTGNNYDNQNAVPGQGPLIYRVDTRFDGNASYNPNGGVYDGIYLFRPGSTPSGNSYTNGTLSSAPFTGTRTAFSGTTTPYAFTTENSIDNNVNIKDIAYDAVSDSYTFFYGTGSNFFEIANTTPIELGCNVDEEAMVEVNANIKWRVTVTPSEASSWIDMSKVSGLNTGTFTVKTVEINTTGVERTATLNFTGNNTTIEIEVTQQACDGILITPTELEFNADGTAIDGNKINIVAADAWTLSSSAAWVHTTPASGNGITEITVSCDANTAATRTATLTFNVGGEDMPTTVQITQNTPIYNIVLTANLAKGGTVEGGGNYELNEEVTINAIENTGYHFVNWTENDTEVSANATYTFTATSNRTLVANFEINSYTVTLSTNPEGAGTVTGGGTFEHDQNVSISATAQGEYKFLNWKENNEVISSSSSYSFTAAADRELVATFELRTYSTTFRTRNSTQESIQGATIFINGETLTTGTIGTATINLSNGTYNSTIEKEGYATVIQQVVVSSSAQTINITMREGYNVTLSVSEEHGNPLEGATITIDESLELTTDAEGKAVVVLQSGDYTYIVEKGGYSTVNGNFTVENGDAEFTIQLLDINETSISEVLVYPNPAENHLIITRSSTSNMQVEIYNVNGVVLQTTEMTDNTKEVDISALTTGIYFIRLTDNENSVTKRFIKK